MEQYFFEYAPIIIVVIAFIFKNKIFATPTELQSLKVEMQTMKVEILNQIKEEYATKELLNFVREDMEAIKEELKDLNAFLRSNYKGK